MKLTSLALTLISALFFMDLFGQSVGFNYISPVPGSRYLNPEQTIILKTGAPFDPQSLDKCHIRIIGSLSGQHEYLMHMSDDSLTVVVAPQSYFEYGEMVHIEVPQGLLTSSGTDIDPSEFSFRIKSQDNLRYLMEYYRRSDVDQDQYVNKRPGVKPRNLLSLRNNLPADYPAPEMVHYGDTDDKSLFYTLTPRGGGSGYKYYLSITDKYGVPLFFRKTPVTCLYFHLMPDGKLAYSNQEFDNPVYEKYYLMDSSFVVVDSVRTGNGYNMDGHDILLMDNGHYLVMAYDPQPVDMSQIVPGGDPEAIVVGLIIQEVDNDEVVYWQWRSWDHFQITDATDDINLLSSYIDYVHGNAFDFDENGDLVLSSRHLDEITKIDWETGNIIWRFGPLAENNEFTVLNDPYGFSHQHDVRVLPTGNITLYDNGNLKPYPFSQALEYNIDETNMTADRVWDYRHQPDVYGSATGSYRRYSNGLNLIGWGATWPLAATETLNDGTETMEVYLPDGVSSYRIVKANWKTNLFEAPSQLHFGNYEGTTGPKHMILPVVNNSDHQIRITSFHNHHPSFDVEDELPLLIPAGQTVELSLSYLPDSLGVYDDILTLNYDKFNLLATERIAIQVKLHGIWDITMPSVNFLPEYGTVNVNPGSSVTVLFSEPVRRFGGNLIENEDIPDLFSFRVENQWGDEIEFSGVISNDRQEITLTPTENLLEEQQYLVKLLPLTIQDDDGNVVSYPEASIFTTGLFTGIDPSLEPGRVQAYPSPFRDKLLITGGGRSISKLTIHNSTGMEVYSASVNKQRIEVLTPNLSPGMYLVEIVLENGSKSVLKVIKAK